MTSVHTAAVYSSISSNAPVPISSVLTVRLFIRASSEASRIKSFTSLAFFMCTISSLGCVVSPVWQITVPRPNSRSPRDA